MTDLITPPRFRWRRLLQFRIRTLFILMAVLAVLLGWWSWKAERQRRAVEYLENREAGIGYQSNMPNYGFFRNDRPLLVDWRYGVRFVGLHQDPTDADIAALQALAGLEEVRVERSLLIDEKRLRDALPACKITQY